MIPSRSQSLHPDPPGTATIDAHHHAWRFDPTLDGWITPGSILAHDFTVGEFDEIAACHGIKRSILVQSRQSEQHTAWLCTQAERSVLVAGVVGWLDLQRPDITDRLSRWRRTPLLIGLRHLVQDELDTDFLLNDAFIRGVDFH